MMTARRMSVSPSPRQLTISRIRPTNARISAKARRRVEGDRIIPGRDQRGAAQEGAEHPAAVERERRDQVGEQQDPVQVAEPADDPDAAERRGQDHLRAAVDPGLADGPAGCAGLGDGIAERVQTTWAPASRLRPTAMLRKMAPLMNGPAIATRKCSPERGTIRRADQVSQRPKMHVLLVAVEPVGRGRMGQFVDRQGDRAAAPTSRPSGRSRGACPPRPA